MLNQIRLQEFLKELAVMCLAQFDINFTSKYKPHCFKNNLKFL